MGASWGPLEASWSLLGSSWAPLEASWSVLGRSWSLLERSWRRLGGHLGGSWEHFGVILDRLGGYSEAWEGSLKRVDAL